MADNATGNSSRAAVLMALAAAVMPRGALAADPAHDPDGRAWWAIVSELADDRYEGRLAGTRGYDRAARQVADAFRALKLEPAGPGGSYFQTVRLVSQTYDPALSAVTVSGASGTSGTVALRVPEDIHFRAGHAMPDAVDAPLVFAGYGLSMPDVGHDDFAGLDVRGRIVVVMAGGPQAISGARKANARSERVGLLAERGAVGLIVLATPAQTEIPWPRQVLLSRRPSQMLADRALRDVPGRFLAGSVSHAAAGALFAGGPYDLATLSALADASAPLPRFAMPARLAARIAWTRTSIRSANIVARLPGADRQLAAEHVVLSAHLDGLGRGEAVDGDDIYNGALDNAAGVASVIGIARRFVQSGQRLRRSVLFLVPTAEEAGLLGSRHFVAHPGVPRGGIVANINFDMPLPIFPLRSVTPVGFEESSLGAAAQAVSAAKGLPILADPFPDRNVFIRSDQYSFVRAGVPALFMKFGFAKGTPEADRERAWRAGIYHSPRDDAAQPVLAAEAQKLNAYTADLLQRIADAPERPRWHADSYFRRFAPAGGAGR